MLLQEYASVILKGIFNSPNFLVDHFKRELTKVKEKGYSEKEFEYEIREVLRIMTDEIDLIYHKNLKDAEKFMRENTCNYKVLDKHETPILSISLPEGTKIHLPKAVFLNDLLNVKNALNELFNYDKLDLNKFTDIDRFSSQIQHCNGLTTIEINEIKSRYLEYLSNADENFYLGIGSKKDGYFPVELSFIDMVLSPATYYYKWFDYDERQKKGKILRIKTSLVELLGLLDSVSNTVSLKYQHKPETIETYLLHWQNLIVDLKYITSIYGHHLIYNPYFPFVEKWLDGLISEYPQTKLINRVALLRQLNSEQKLEKNNDATSATHREVIIAHTFKAKLGLEIEKTPTQWKEERGEKARQAYYTLIKQSDNYKPFKEKELKNVIQLLNEFPKAQKMAINELEALERL